MAHEKKRRVGKGSENGQAAHAPSNRWLPEGVINFKTVELTDAQRDHILQAAKAKRSPRKHEFIEEIEIAIGVFHGERAFLSRTTPAQVRGKMRRLEKHAKALIKEIEGLDEYSIQLLSRSGRGPKWSRSTTKRDDEGLHVGAMPDGTPLFEIREGFTFNEAAVAVEHLKYHSSAVLAATENYPRHRLEDLATKHLAYDVAAALKNHLGINPTTGTDGIFAQVLRLVLEYAGDRPKLGVDHETRDVRGLVSGALSELRSGRE